MSSEISQAAAAVVDAGTFGPAMLALPTDRQRAFVVALFAVRPGRGCAMRAAQAAGFGTENSTNKSLSTIASRLMADERVQEAMAEESRKRLRALSPAAIVALEKLILNPRHRDHMRALATVLDRADPVQTSHVVKVQDERRPSPAELEGMTARVLELARAFGLTEKMPPMIDATPQEAAS